MEALDELLDGTLFGDFRRLIKKAEADYIKARQGNKSAGVRCRKALKEAEDMVLPLRKEILSYYRPEKSEESKHSE